MRLGKLTARSTDTIATRRISHSVYTRDPRSIAIVLAMELSKIIQKPLSVTTAEFVEPAKAELYKFSGANTSDVAPAAILGLAAINRRDLSLVLANRN